MKNPDDVRWLQRFDNFSKALKSFRTGLELANQRELSDLEKQGLIQSFEFCHELAWNTLKDLLEYQGISGMLGSRDAVREAFSRGLITHGDDWIDMIKSRNLSSDTYNKNIADQIVKKILESYGPLFEELFAKLQSLPK
jgi:nucleotidyltransferase substrate binding protein (TIGR01987 family)